MHQDGRLDLEPAEPVLFLETPPDTGVDAKRALVMRISSAMTDAYALPGVLIFLREYPPDMVSQGVGMQSENPVILEAMRRAAQPRRGSGAGFGVKQVDRSSRARALYVRAGMRPM